MCEGVTSHFPYPKYRPGQLDLIRIICESIQDKGIHAIEAPNGIGKTSSILTNVAYYVKRGLIDGFVYLVRTHRQIERVLDELSHFNLKVAPLRGKGELCLMGFAKDEVYEACNTAKRSGECPFNRQVDYEGAPLRLQELVKRSLLLKTCPYYWSLRRLRQAELVIAPINYLLEEEPWKVLSGWLEGREVVLVVDEAHNLSRHLIGSQVRRLDLDFLISEEIKKAGVDFIEIPRKYAQEALGLKLNGRIFVDSEGNALILSDMPDRRDRLRSFYATILVSGTWGPDRLVSKEVGVRLSVKRVTPDWGSKVRVLVTEDLTTKYSERKYSLRMIYEMLVGVINSLEGNVGVFTPSYDMLEYFREMGLEDHVDKPVYFENDSYSLEEFKSMADRGGAVLLGVQSGRISEGVDFPGNEMIASIVVGLQLPKPGLEQKLRRFVELSLFGEDREIELLHAVRAASQAAGRCVRGPDDVGFIVLADYRFLIDRVRSMLPYWILSKMTPVTSEEVPKLAKSFKRLIRNVRSRP